MNSGARGKRIQLWLISPSLSYPEANNTRLNRCTVTFLYTSKEAGDGDALLDETTDECTDVSSFSSLPISF